MNTESAEVDRAAVNGESPPSGGWRWVAAVLGLAVLAVGGVATFRSTNGAGSAALVGGGIALLVLGGLGDRIELLKFGNVEFHLRAAARQLIRRADELERHGNIAAAEQLRGEADRLLLQASPATRRYEKLRRIRPPGPRRTAELYDLVGDARQYSKNQHPPAEAVRELFTGVGDGARVYALVLMEEDPVASNLVCVLDGISRSRSAFEQYRALSSALKMLPQLDTSSRNQLADAIRQQMKTGGYVMPSNPGRYSLAQQILNVTDSEESQ